MSASEPPSSLPICIQGNMNSQKQHITPLKHACRLEYSPIIRNQPAPSPDHPMRGYSTGGQETVWAGADFIWSKNALASPIMGNDVRKARNGVITIWMHL